MKFSICVPVYNVSQFLPVCMDSLLNQDYQSYEVILVDDGSTDSSGMLCDQYAMENPETVRVIHHQLNRGLLCARRTAITAAKGDYCLFVDSDDTIVENMLITLDAALNKMKDPDVLLYEFRYIMDGKPSERRVSVAENGYIWNRSQKRELYTKLFFTNEITPIWMKCVLTALLKNDPTDYAKWYGKNMGEDQLQSLYILSEAETIGYTDVVLYNYMVNNQSMSHIFDPKMIKNKSTLHVYDLMCEYLVKWDMNSDENRARLNARWFNQAMWELSQSYEAASSKAERNAVLRADWRQLIPAGVMKQSKAFMNNSYLQLYGLYEKQDYFGIHMFFVKNTIRKKWKTIKKSFFL